MTVLSGRHQAPQARGGREASRGKVSETAALERSSPEFVGRDDAFAKITEALDAGPALVLIEGEAGIGKTRLLHETVASLPDRCVLLAACPPLPEPFPLGAVVAGLRKFHERIVELELSPLGGALRPLFPEWAEILPSGLESLDDPKETRHRILRALTELVERLEIDVVMVEDAHWADNTTLEWLLTLSAAEDSLRSIVTTCRPSDVPEGSLLRRLTSRLPAGWTQARVELQPLDVDQTRQLVGSMLRTDEVSEQFATFLHEHTDGLPLAVEETVRLMRERHDIIRQHGHWTRKVLDELDVPPTLRDSVLERVERLDLDARAILWAAAVLGEPADASLLTIVANLDQESGQRGVRDASRAGLLRHTGVDLLAFRHQLDAKTVEESIPVSDRWGLHRRAAGALQQLDPKPVVRLARHFREAGDTDASCEYAEAAADLALEAGDDHAAVMTLLEVLTSVKHPIGRRVRLARKLAEAAFFGAAALGDLVHEVADALRAVLDTDSIPQGDRGELRLYLGRMLWDGDGLAAFEEMEAAIPDLGHRPDLARTAMTNISMPVIPEWPASRHLSWLDRADELVERTGKSSDWQVFDGARAVTLLLLGEEEGWAFASQLPSPPASPKEQRLFATTLLGLAEMSLAWGRYDGTRRLLDVAVEYVESSEYQRRLSLGRLIAVYLGWYTGRWQGLRASAVAIAESDEIEPRDQLQAWQLVGLLDLAAGARAEAERRLRDIATEYARHHRIEPQDMAVPAALARLYLSDGSAEKALRETGPAVELIAEKGVWLWAGDICPVHMDALVATAELGQAADLVRNFTTGLAGRNAPSPAAALATCRAILTEAKGHLSQAAELFTGAAKAWATLPRPYDELLTLERQGRCLVASGQQDDGLAVLSEAQQRLHDLGARRDADRVAHLLRQHGVDVMRTWRRGRHGYGDKLSPREIEVVELVAQGMTNREVGERLFISPKTVHRHLSTAMRKLDVHSRTSLAMAASRAGLLSTDGDR